jgi:hypothetical protein
LISFSGGPCESKRLSIRLVAGVWTLATFIFVQAYSSILFTYVVAPVNRPLINSIYDIFDNSDINLFVRVRTIDLLIQASLKLSCALFFTSCATDNQTIKKTFFQIQHGQKNDTTAIYREIAKRLDSKSISRCAYISECIQKVTPGSRNIFMEVKCNECHTLILFFTNLIIKLGKFFCKGRNQSRVQQDWEMQLAVRNRRIRHHRFNVCPTETKSLY